jgi:hypothetical protein
VGPGPNLQNEVGPLAAILVTKQSPVQGKGLFSVVDLPKGFNLGGIYGIKPHAGMSAWENTRHLFGLQMFQYSNRKKRSMATTIIDMSLFGWVNHSCNPNLRLTRTGQYITMSKIRAGDEFLHDYGTQASREWDLNVGVRFVCFLRVVLKGICQNASGFFLTLMNGIPTPSKTIVRRARSNSAFFCFDINFPNIS